MTASHHVYEQFENTPLWRALAKALKDLEASRELTLDTAPHYVIGYLCQELAAKQLIVAPSLARDR